MWKVCIEWGSANISWHINVHYVKVFLHTPEVSSTAKQCSCDVRQDEVQFYVMSTCSCFCGFILFCGVYHPCVVILASRDEFNMLFFLPIMLLSNSQEMYQLC